MINYTRYLQSPGWSALIIFMIALLPKLAFMFLLAPEPGSDAVDYLRTSQTLVEHGVFGATPDEPRKDFPILQTVFFAPFVKLFGPRPVQALFVQCLLAALSSALIYLLARNIGGNLAGWSAGLLSAAYLPMVAYPSRYLTETLSLFWFVVTLLLVDRLLRAERPKAILKWSILTGVVFALMALTRVVTFPLLACPLAFLLFKFRGNIRRAIPGAVALCVVFAAVYSPWVIRNYVVFGKPTVLTSRNIRSQENKPPYLENGFIYLCAEYVAQGYNLEEARELTAKNVDEFLKDPPYLRQSEFEKSTTYARHSVQRFFIMLGIHPCLVAHYPLTGTTVEAYPSIRWLNYTWHRFMFPCLLIGLIGGVIRRDIHLLHVFALPFTLVACYSITHAIPRYQILPYFGWTVCAGVGLSILTHWLWEKWGRRPHTQSLGATTESGTGADVVEDS